jgi:hypothetical protein
MVLPCDASGYAIPAADLELDFLTDHDASDPDEGPPESWPIWCDE